MLYSRTVFCCSPICFSSFLLVNVNFWCCLVSGIKQAEHTNRDHQYILYFVPHKTLFFCSSCLSTPENQTENQTVEMSISDLANYWMRLITCRDLQGGKRSSYIRVSPAVLLLRDYTAWTPVCFIVSTDVRSGLDKQFLFFANSAVGVWHWSLLYFWQV
jgi:hypothetical protein